MKSSPMHNTTRWIKTDNESGNVTGSYIGNDPAWRGHAQKERERRYLHKKRAKRARRLNRGS